MADAIKGPALPIENKLMWHTVIHISHENKAIAVEITSDPYEHSVKAAIIMHKTSSYSVAKQIARVVRRATNLTTTSTHRAGRPKEAMLGYAVSRTQQYPPNERTPYFDLVKRIAETSVRELLKQSDMGNNASRSRYVTMEVRDANKVYGRFVTNKALMIEKLWASCYPDKAPKAGVFVAGRFASHQEAQDACGDFLFDYKTLWTRKPPREYVDAVLESPSPGEFNYKTSGFSAVRDYAYGSFVQIGPHVYTKAQVMALFSLGWWVDGRVNKKELGGIFEAQTEMELDDDAS